MSYKRKHSPLDSLGRKRHSSHPESSSAAEKPAQYEQPRMLFQFATELPKQISRDAALPWPVVATLTDPYKHNIPGTYTAHLKLTTDSLIAPDNEKKIIGCSDGFQIPGDHTTNYYMFSGIRQRDLLPGVYRLEATLFQKKPPKHTTAFTFNEHAYTFEFEVVKKVKDINEPQVPQLSEFSHDCLSRYPE